MKNQNTIRNFVGSAAVIAACLIFAGCAGGGSGGTSVPATAIGPSTRSATGRVNISVAWPAPSTASTRLIPVLANSILVQFLTNDGKKTVVASTVLSRPLVEGKSAKTRAEGSPSPVPTLTASPPTGIPTSTDFVDLPAGNYLVSAAAYPTYSATTTPVQADGSTTAEASATTAAPITIVAGQTTAVPLTLASTIATVDIEPRTISFTGDPVSLTATAKDAQGNLVLTNSFVWATSDDTVIDVSYDGPFATLTAAGPGFCNITATETESNKSFSLSLGVGAQQD